MPSEPFFSQESKVEAGFLVGKWFGILAFIGTSARLIGTGGKFRLGTFSRRLLEKHPSLRGGTTISSRGEGVIVGYRYR